MFSVLMLYGAMSESDDYSASFGCEIIALTICTFSSALRMVICRGEIHGPYENIY